MEITFEVITAMSYPVSAIIAIAAEESRDLLKPIVELPFATSELTMIMMKMKIYAEIVPPSHCFKLVLLTKITGIRASL